MSPVDPYAAEKAWLAQDPDPVTRDELSKMIEAAELGVAGAMTALADRFSARLEFGTAGLRGELGAGPNRMNRVLVAQAAAGFADFLLDRENAPSVVVGYDGRTNSRIFAEDTAELMAGVGVRTILLPRALPTPVLAFAVRHLDVSAGVMVTASHNPGTDNGYKVYLGGTDNGSQIVPPADGAIAARIEAVATGSITDLPRAQTFEIAGEEVLDAYVDRTAAGVARPARRPNVVYTPMHGVGWETAHRVFVEAGFGAPAPVPAQVEPDAAFPTVVFPNPEEPGAMDLAFALGAQLDAELVIANDPDADRLAIGLPGASGWRRLSGNEVGWMLGWRAAAKLTGKSGRLAASIVSSPALAAVAKEYGLEFVETLTGFKWISRVPGLAFGYEEALGYLVDPDKVRDKDGISAAVEFLSLWVELTESGSSWHDHELAFAEKFGAFASSQISHRVDDLADIPRIMAELRANQPKAVGSQAVTRIEDFLDGVGDFPPSDILRIWFASGARVIVRPSGTEPKLKVYIDASSTTGTAAERIAAAKAIVDELDVGMRTLVGA
ncbi:MAG: phospho-sugar mutase [Rhodoglobus sp.]